MGKHGIVGVFIGKIIFLDTETETALSECSSIGVIVRNRPGLCRLYKPTFYFTDVSVTTRPGGDEWPGGRVISVGPPLGVDPAGKMRLRISNNNNNNLNWITVHAEADRSVK